MCYVTSTCFIKISILTFYTRLSIATSRIVSRLLQASIALMALYWIICLVTLCFPCHPMQAYYEQFDPAWAATHTFSCYAESPVLMSMAVISVVQGSWSSDFWHHERITKPVSFRHLHRSSSDDTSMEAFFA